ncbi:hypothetical protein GCM10012290_09990 [Halolactibacillus alkaliphilus]|uniref:Uncharacterized protein n=1 Tax=Halolactibacillus alkaliphilus TaxID=442899 RepID=A0A511X3D7_9BACI|nr:hypothetical protein [Halolactibacillus alkaliphilus]GEN57453.1 hypothetical protein HAL01_19170 [Halolactibacillus alkaliphilus]GGN68378.1 hypothetical protein GCM10012290_09990 [Halolactibacillus alkaliphilus]SFO95258.1 hypothetical protein SAMN05720591_12527 [Halolactibacillus alkaliphilus]
MLDSFEIELIGVSGHAFFFEQQKREILVRAEDPIDAYSVAILTYDRTTQMDMSTLAIRYVFKETIEEDPTADMTEYYLLRFEDNAIHCQVKMSDVYQTTHVLGEEELFDFLYGLIKKLYLEFPNEKP